MTNEFDLYSWPFFCYFKLRFVLMVCFCICILVSCLCWNDGILVTASWDSTVKVSLIHLSRKIFRDAGVSFSCLSMEDSWRKWLTSFNRFDYLDGFRTFSRLRNCKCVLSYSLQGLEVFSWTRWQETLAAWNPGKICLLIARLLGYLLFSV